MPSDNATGINIHCGKETSAFRSLLHSNCSSHKHMTHCRNCKRKDRKQQFHWAMKFIRNPSNFYFRGWRAYESRCCVLIILLWQPTPTSRTRHPFRTLSHNGHKTRLVWHQRCFTTLARTPTTNRRKRLTFTIYTTKVVPLKTLPVLSEGKRCESEGAFRLLFFHSILISLSLSLSLLVFFFIHSFFLSLDAGLFTYIIISKLVSTRFVSLVHLSIPGSKGFYTAGTRKKRKDLIPTETAVRKVANQQ